MVKKLNKETGVLEVHTSATITEIRDQVLYLKNAKETPYKLGNCSLTYPDGGTENILTRFYTKSIEANPETFKAGNRITIRIQAEGEYVGRSVAHLPSALADVDRLLGKTTKVETITDDNNGQGELVA